MRSDGGSEQGAPRWVKVSGLIAAILVALLLVMVVTGTGGPHGPGRHLSG
jgi:hypothetical protein